MRLDMIKKVFVLLIAACSVSLISISNINAQGGATPVVEQAGPLLTQSQQTATAAQQSSSYLQNIDNGINRPDGGIVKNVADILTLMTKASWHLRQDDSKLNPNVISDLATLGAQVATNSAESLAGKQTPYNQQLIITTNQLGSLEDLKAKIPQVNDLVYSSVLGQPMLGKDSSDTNQDPDPNANHAQNWVMYASGIKNRHVIPPPSGWRGDAHAKAVYTNYFNVSNAAASFNAYALSSLEQYKDLSALEKQVMQEVSDFQNWFSTIESENIGWVLRQILIFQSIATVYLIRLTQIEQNILTASVLTNSVVMASNAQWENNMVMKAQGVTPT